MVTPLELKQIRDGMGWTQEEAAVKAGVTRNTWARWERGEVEPHPLRERDLQRFLRVAERRAAKRTGTPEHTPAGQAVGEAVE